MSQRGEFKEHPVVDIAESRPHALCGTRTGRELERKYDLCHRCDERRRLYCAETGCLVFNRNPDKPQLARSHFLYTSTTGRGAAGGVPPAVATSSEAVIRNQVEQEQQQ